jgi:ribosomal protein S18 acetylase RimI-like enzyme
MDIRLATDQDAEIVSALNEEVQRVHADALPHLFKQPSQETFPATLVRQLLADPTTYMFIAYSNGTPVGYIYTQIIRRAETSLRYAYDRLFIHHISVDQAYQRQGVGQALLQTAVGLAREHGIARIGLDVWSFNTPARAFFVSQGFSVYHEDMWLHLGSNSRHR